MSFQTIPYNPRNVQLRSPTTTSPTQRLLFANPESQWQALPHLDNNYVLSKDINTCSCIKLGTLSNDVLSMLWLPHADRVDKLLSKSAPVPYTLPIALANPTCLSHTLPIALATPTCLSHTLPIPLATPTWLSHTLPIALSIEVAELVGVGLSASHGQTDIATMNFQQNLKMMVKEHVNRYIHSIDKDTLWTTYVAWCARIYVWSPL